MGSVDKLYLYHQKVLPRRAHSTICRRMLPTDYPKLKRRAVIAALDALGDTMVTEIEGDIASGDTEFPPAYTYWGQFIDHDMTRNTDRNLVAGGHSATAVGTTPFDIRADDFSPTHPDQVRNELANLRTHSLDLDSVYGDGPQIDSDLYCPGNDEFHFCAGRDGDLLLENTPLWFYVLKEAGLLSNDNQLGPVGSRIIVDDHCRCAAE